MLPPRAVRSIVVAALVGVAACGASSEGESAAEATPAVAVSTETTVQTETAASTETTTPAATSTVEDNTETSAADQTDDEDAAMATDPAEPVCTRLTDFSIDADNQQWLVVNDDVMGGRSLGGVTFEDNTMIFAGEVNTNGGGFASLRLPLPPDALTEFSAVAVRARPDDRTYVITFDDNLPARNRRVSHRAPIPFGSPGEWQTVTVPFEDLFPAIFGQPIDDLPFRPDLAVRMGLMISDGVDGPFQLDLDWIDLCP